MKRRGILKICFLLLVILSFMFLVSCADLADFEKGDEEDQFDAYYKYFGDIVALYYEDGEEEKDTFDMDEIYNRDTQDKGTSPVEYRKYKYIFVTLEKDIYLDGIGIFFRTKAEQAETKIMIEAYYATGWNIAKEDDYTCDMFRGTYEYNDGSTIIKVHLDGHGKCSSYSKSKDPATGNETVVEYEDQPYTTKITDTIKMFTIMLPNGDVYEIQFNPNTKNKFDGYINGNHRKSKTFAYTSDFDLGTIMFDGSRTFEPNELGSFFADEYTMELTDGTKLEGQKHIHLEEGNGILFKILNNCFDGPKYDLTQVEVTFNNIVMRNKKGE